jgi:ankyrin repeat protein
MSTTKDLGHELCSAAMDGEMKLCEELITQGADVKFKDEEGNTPLHLAALYGKEKTCLLLAKNKSNLNSIDNLGHAPLHMAYLG